jgi:hypothetical protein
MLGALCRIRAFVPQQNLAVEILACSGLSGGNFEYVGDEVHGLPRLTIGRAIEQFRCY